MTTATSEAALSAPSQLLFLSSRAHDQIQWTEELVLRRIYERQRAGLTLARKDVRQEAPRLFNATLRRFGTWTAALEVAGIDQPRADRHDYAQTRERIITRLREHASAGLPISSAHPLLKNCAKSSRRVFGSWAAALEAAGVNPTDRMAKHGRYTRELILSRLREHSAAGLPVMSTHPLLRKYKSAVRCLFGSWAAAMAFAGVRPAERVRRVFVRRAVAHTRESIIGLLRELDTAGLPFSSSQMPLSGCWRAMRRLFGSLPAALDAAGINIARQVDACLTRKEAKRVAERERILEVFRRRTRDSLSVAVTHPEMQRYYGPARRLFGSWNKAREAAGCAHSRPLGEKEMCIKREELLNMLRERTRTGFPVESTNVVMRPYRDIARRLFGSWSKAREAAGCPRPGRCGADKVLDAIIAALDGGRKPYANDPDLRSFKSAARRHFGSWQEAVKQARQGRRARLPTEPPVEGFPKTRDGIIALIRDHARQGIAITSKHPILKQYRRVAIRLFGSWGEARRAAGFLQRGRTNKQSDGSNERAIPQGGRDHGQAKGQEGNRSA